MSSFKRRLVESVARLGMADGAVAERLGAAGYDATHDKVYRWKKGKSLPEIDDLPMVAEGLGVDLVWLATGRIDAKTLDPDMATLVVVAESLRLPLDEAIRRLSTPAIACGPAGASSPASTARRVIRTRDRTAESLRRLGRESLKEDES